VEIVTVQLNFRKANDSTKNSGNSACEERQVEWNFGKPCKVFFFSGGSGKNYSIRHLEIARLRMKTEIFG